MNEKQQRIETLARRVAANLAAQPQEIDHKPTCASLNIMLTVNPPRPAACDCGAEPVPTNEVKSMNEKDKEAFERWYADYKRHSPNRPLPKTTWQAALTYARSEQNAAVQGLVDALEEIKVSAEDCADGIYPWPHKQNYADIAAHAASALAAYREATK